MNNIYAKSLIFDCDGVIFDSNQLKVQAFRNTLNEYPVELVDRFITYHKKHGGISRYVKFKYFLDVILEIPDEAYLLDKWLSYFGNNCLELYMKAQLTEGCLDVLNRYYGLKNLYIASGSDQEELRQIFKNRKIYKFFKYIYGSPKTKEECIDIITNIEIHNEFIFIGDSLIDYEVAQKYDLDFIFVHKYSDDKDGIINISKSNNIPIIETLNSLLGIII